MEPFEENNKNFERSLRRSFDFQDLRLGAQNTETGKTKKPKAQYQGIANKLRELYANNADMNNDFIGGWNINEENSGN